MKKAIDILGIILPSLILIFTIIRLTVRNRKAAFNGIIFFLAFLLLLVGIFRFLFFGKDTNRVSGPKQQPIPVSKHSEAFNQSVESTLNSYYALVNGFSRSDTAAIRNAAAELSVKLDSMKVDELKTDTTGIYETALDPLNQAKFEADRIINAATIEEKRSALHNLSENFRLLLIVVKYDRAKIYWHECVVAFGADRPGNWLSASRDVNSPYANVKDPENPSRPCGIPKDTINFVPVDTTSVK